MREDHARALLARAGADQGPPLGVDVTDLVRRGRRRKRIRRYAVVASSSAGTAVAVLVVTLLLAHRPAQVSPADDGPLRPVAPTTTPFGPSVTPMTTPGVSSSTTTPAITTSQLSNNNTTTTR